MPDEKLFNRTFHHYCRRVSLSQFKRFHAPFRGHIREGTRGNQLCWFTWRQRHIEVPQRKLQAGADCFNVSFFSCPAIEESLGFPSALQDSQGLLLVRRKETPRDFVYIHVVTDALDIHSDFSPHGKCKCG